MTTDKIKDTRARLKLFAEWTGAKPPKDSFDGVGNPTKELLRYCTLEWLDRDWLLHGDVKAMVLEGRKHREAKARRDKFEMRYFEIENLMNALILLQLDLCQMHKGEVLRQELRDALIGVIDVMAAKQKKATKHYMKAECV